MRAPGEKDEESGEGVNETTNLAHARTSLANKRTSLANERTYSAWIRTSLALVAVALALPRLIETTQFVLLSRAIGLIFIAVSVVLFISASRRYKETNALLKEEGLNTISPTLLDLISFALLACLVLSALLLI